jgi:hypothetical protein
VQEGSQRGLGSPVGEDSIHAGAGQKVNVIVAAQASNSATGGQLGTVNPSS